MLDSIAKWVWVIAPKENRFGSQEIAFDVFVKNGQGKLLGVPNDSVQMTITNQLGVPAGLIYFGTALSGFASFPIWTWIYNEWSMRAKERRDNRSQQPVVKASKQSRRKKIKGAK